VHPIEPFLRLQSVLDVFFSSSPEDAMLKAFQSLYLNILGTASSARVEFYDKLQRETNEYDINFMKNRVDS